MGRLLLALALATGSLLFGCGGDDDSPSAMDAGVPDADTDTDTDTDADGDTDTDSDVDTELCPEGVLDGDFTLANYDDFELIDDCEEITGTLCVFLCLDCEDLVPLGSLTTVGADLQIIANDMVVDLAGLEALTSVGGELMIIENEGLISLAGLDALSSVGGKVIVEANMLLPYCEVCDLLDRIEELAPDAGLGANLADDCGSDAGLHCDGAPPDGGPDGGE